MTYTKRSTDLGSIEHKLCSELGLDRSEPTRRQSRVLEPPSAILCRCFEVDMSKSVN